MHTTRASVTRRLTCALLSSVCLWFTASSVKQTRRRPSRLSGAAASRPLAVRSYAAWCRRHRHYYRYCHRHYYRYCHHHYYRHCRLSDRSPRDLGRTTCRRRRRGKPLSQRPPSRASDVFGKARAYTSRANVGESEERKRKLENFRNETGLVRLFPFEHGAAPS